MIDWSAIDTVLLDMDGTLLDLHFDTYFWASHLPRRYAEHHGLCPEESTRYVHGLMREKHGSLDWYCLDFWSRELQVDVRALKEEVQHLIAERPHAVEFLRRVKAAGKTRILITNAHPLALELKLSLTGIGDHLDTIISSHQFGAPKEEPAFWRRLRRETGFDPARSLFIDDSEAILAAAERFGVAYPVSLLQPDSRQPLRPPGRYPAIHHFDEIFPEDATVHG